MASRTHRSLRRSRPAVRRLALGVSWSRLWAYSALAVTAVGTAAHAAPLTWTAGSGIDLQWETPANWDGNIVPVSTSDVLFPGQIPNPAALLNPSVVLLGTGDVANSLSFANSYFLQGGTLALTSGAITVSPEVTATIDTQLTGAGGLVKTGTGTLRLTNGANNFTGATTISFGTVAIASAGALGSDATPISIFGNLQRVGGGGGSLTIGSANNNLAGLTFTRALNVTGGGVTGDHGALYSVGTNVFTGKITAGGTGAGTAANGGATQVGVSGTRLVASSGTTTLSGGVSTTISGQALALHGNGTWVIDSAIDGAGNFQKAGPGLLLLKGNNTALTGTLIMSAGNTRVESLAALGSSTATTAINMDSGTLEVRVDAGLVTGKNVNLNNSSSIFVDHTVTGSGLNGTVSFKDIISNNRTLTYNSRNGYNLTFLNGNNNANAFSDAAGFTANGNGLLTLTDDFIQNATSIRAITFAGNGETRVTGSYKTVSTQKAHTLVKSGTGILQLDGLTADFTGTTTAAGTLRIAGFGALNNVAGATSALLLGSTTTSGTLDYRGAGETVVKAIQLNSTGGAVPAGVILANQQGATQTPLLLNGAFSVLTDTTARSFYLGGSNTLDNTLSAAIPNTGTGLLSVAKVGTGTWVLAGANTYGGNTTIAGGTLKLAVNATDVVPNGSAVIFAADALTGRQAAGGTLELVTPNSATNQTETVGALTPTAGMGTVKITRGGAGSGTLAFSSVGTYGNGAAVNFVPGTGTNGASYAYVLTGAAGLVNTKTYFNGADYAFMDNTAGAVRLRAPIYGAGGDAGFSAANTFTTAEHALLTATQNLAASQSQRSIKFNAAAGEVRLNLGTGVTLSLVNTGGTNTAGGLLATNGSSLILGGTGISTGGANNLSIRTEGMGTSLTLDTPLTSGTTGGLTKSGEGKLVLTRTNAYTGNTYLLEGTTQVQGTNSLGSANNALELRQAATLDLFGTATGVGVINGAGNIINTSGSTATLTIGNNNGGGVFSGNISGAVNVTKTGSGSISLIGNNTYSGVTSFNTTSGRVDVTTLANIGQPSSLGVGVGTDTASNQASWSFNGGTLRYSGSTGQFQQAEQTPSVSIDRLFTLAGNGTLDSSPQFGNNVNVAAAQNNAALIFANTEAIAHTGTAARTLAVQGTSTGDNEFRPLLQNGAGAAVLNFTKAGNGLWILSNQNNSYTGATTISAGQLRVVGTAMPAGSGLTFTGSTTAGGTLQMAGTFERPVSATIAAGTVNWNATGTGGFSASTSKLTVSLGGAGSPTPLTWGANGFVANVLLLGSATSLAETEFTNAIDFGAAARTVQVDTNTTASAVTAGISLGDYSTLSGVLTGAGGGLTKTGSGLLRVTGDNLYTGNTTITAGTLRVSSLGSAASTSSNLGAGSGKVALQGGTLSYRGSGETSNRLIEIGFSADSTLDASGSGPLVLTNVTNTAIATRNLILGGDSPFANEITSALTNGVGGVTLNVSKNQGVGTWILSGQSTYTGTTTITGSTAVGTGVLSIGANSTQDATTGAIISGPIGLGKLIITNAIVGVNDADRTIANDVQLTMNANSNFIGNHSLSILGAVTVLTGGTLTVANGITDGGVLTLGKLDGTGITSLADTTARTIVFQGAGQTVLNSGLQEVTGATPAAAHALQFNGQTPTASLTLGGTNLYSGTTTVNMGILKVGKDQALPSGTGRGNLTLNPTALQTATLDLGGHTQTINGLTTATIGVSRLDNSAATPGSLTFGNLTTTTADTFKGQILNTGTGALSITKQNGGAATFTDGPFSHQGTTSVIGGSLTLAGDVTATTGLSAAGTGTLLALSGGFSGAAGVPSVSVTGGGHLNLFDGVGTPLSGLTSLTLANGATLSLNVGTPDTPAMGQTPEILGVSDRLALTGTATVTGAVTLNLRDTGQMEQSSSYKLLTATGGGLLDAALGMGTYTLSQIPGGFSFLTLTQTPNAITLNTGLLSTASLYWTGAYTANPTAWNAVDGAFRGLNFSPDKSGATISDFVPGTGTVVIFQANNAPGGVVNTTLEQGFRIRGLEFEASTNTPTTVNIAPGALATNRLTLQPVDATTGITLKTGGPTAVNISSQVGLAAPQTWTVAPAAGVLTVSGALAGSSQLTIAGAGKVVLSGTADPTYGGGAVRVGGLDAQATPQPLGGVLELANVAALGTATLSNLAPISVEAGGRFYYNNTTSGTVANALTLNGGILAVASATQTYSGAITINSASTLSLRDFGTNAAQARSLNLTGNITGAGALIINSDATVSTTANALNGTLVITMDNPNFTGPVNIQQGTIDLRMESSLGKGAVTVNAGRVLLKGTPAAAGTTWRQFTNGLTVDGPAGRAVFELQMDSQSTTATLTTDVNGPVTLGGSGAAPTLRIYTADALSPLIISGAVTLKADAQIHSSGASTGLLTNVISGAIGETGGSFGLGLNTDTTWGSNNFQVLRLDGANTFTGPLTIGGGTVDYSTAGNVGATSASNLGQGGAINLNGGTLRFVGGTAQSTDRPVNLGAAATLAANGTGGAGITYSGTINAGANQLTLIGTGAGTITGSILQTGTAADLLVNGGTWNLNGANLFADDVIVTGLGAVLNLNTEGGLNYQPATSSGLYARTGAVINLNAPNVNGVNNANSLDFIILGDSGAGDAATLNTNGNPITTPQLSLGSNPDGFTGNVRGSGLVTVNYTGTDYAQGIRLFRGEIDAPLAGTATIIKGGSGIATLRGDNSGLTTTTATRADAGTLVLDYTASNTSKLAATAALDIRGAAVVLNGNAAADTVQTVNNITFSGGGASRITLNSAPGFATTFNLGTLTRSASTGVVIFEPPTQGSITTTTANNAATGLLGAYALVRDTAGALHFARKDVAGTALGNIVPIVETEKEDITTWTAADNVVDGTLGFYGTKAGGSVSSVRVARTEGGNIQVANGTALNLVSGGLLVRSTVTGPVNITGGTLLSGTSNELIFHTMGAEAQTVTLGSQLRGATALTKAGPGSLVLTGNNNSTTGTLTITEGKVRLEGGRAVGDTALISFSDDKATTLQLGADETTGRLNGGNNTTGFILGLLDLGANNLTINSSGGNVTFAGLVAGSGTLTKNGAGLNTNQGFTGISTGFTGPVVINGGTFSLSSLGQLNSTAFTLNSTGVLLLDNNSTTRSTTRILDATPITLNSADGAYSGSTIPRGLNIRTDQQTTLTETIGNLNLNSGQSYIAAESSSTATSGTPSVSNLFVNNVVRTNAATVDLRGRNLGSTVTTEFRAGVRISTAANETAFLTTLVGGGGAAGTATRSIVPWAIGESYTGTTLLEGNMGNSLVTYISGTGFAPLPLADYSTYAAAGATSNVRELVTTGLGGLGGKTVNALVLHDDNNAAAPALPVSVTGTGAALPITSGAMLFTLNPAATGAHSLVLSGIDAGITVASTGEYVVQVVNPSSLATGPTLAVTIGSPLASAADLTKAGRGTLVLTAANTAGGGAKKTTLNEGVLEISGLTNIGGNTGGLVFAGGTLRLGAGYTGDDLSQRTISFQQAGGTLDQGAFNLTMANSLGSGPGGFTKVGAGTLALNGAASYTGPTFLSGGAVTLGASQALGTGDLTVTDTTLNLGANNLNVASFTAAGTTGALTGTGTLTSSGLITLISGTVDAKLAGTGGLLKTNTAGTLTLTGLNTFTGPVEILNGTLSINSLGGLGQAGALGAPTTAADGVIRLAGGTTLNYTGAAAASDRRLALTGAGTTTLDADGTGALVLAGGLGTEVAGARALVLQGSSAPNLENYLGVINEGAATLSVTKNDASSWTIGGTGGYAGATVINDGKLRFESDVTLGGAVTLGSYLATGSIAPVLDATTSNVTIGGAFTSAAASPSGPNNPPLAGQLLVGPGMTFTVGGNFSVGSTQAASTESRFTATGGGTLLVNNAAAGGTFIIGGAVTGAGFGNNTVADLTGLSQVGILLNPTNSTVRVNPASSSNVAEKFSQLLLPTTGAGATTIRANLLDIGDSGQLNGTGAATNRLALGSGVNTLNINTINIGTGARDVGTLNFGTGTGTLVVRGADGVSPATLNMGTGSASTAVPGGVLAGGGNVFDTTGHQADILLGTVSMGLQDIRNSDVYSTFKFDQGTLVTGNVIMSRKLTNGATNTGGKTQSFMTLSGGTVTIGTGTGPAFTLAAMKSTTAGAASEATVAVRGSAVTVKGDIVRGEYTTGTATATVVLASGSLNLEGHAIGGAGAAALVSFSAEGGTLLNLGELNGGATLTKSSGGELTLAGLNTYTGGTDVTAGSLVVSGPLPNTSLLNVAPGAMLSLGASDLLNNAAGLTLAGIFKTNGYSEGTPGASGLGVLTLTGTATIDFGAAAAGSQLFFSGYNIAAGATLNILNWDGAAFTEGGALSDRLVFQGSSAAFEAAFAQNMVSFNGESGYSIIPTGNGFEVAIPEPSSGLLLMAAGLGLAGFRRRRNAAR